MTLTKAQIAKVICSKTGTPKWRSAELVDGVFEVIKETLESGEDVLISGFGKWSVKEKGERQGKNPQTGEPIMLAPRRVVKFKCGSALRDRIDGKRQHMVDKKRDEDMNH
jgi:integration host factor subunit alpha